MGMGGQLEKGLNIDGGTDGTSIGNVSDSLKVNVSNTVTVVQNSSSVPSYSAAAVFTAASAATDIFTITGSATKTILIRDIYLYGTATAGANTTVRLIRRSTANTGGTSTTVAGVSYDTNNPAATATVRAYTANPTALGTTVGDIWITGVYLSGGGTIGSIPFRFQPDAQTQQSLTLRGTSQTIAINLNGGTFSGNSFRAFVIWTEE